MKRARLVVLVMFWIVSALPLKIMAEDLGALHLSQMQGDVQIQSRDASDWVPAAVNLPLRAGDRVWVPKESWTQIDTHAGSLLRLDSESALDLRQVEGALHATLGQGQVYVRYRKGSETQMQIDSSTASIRALESAVFNLAMERNGAILVSVFHGEVYVANSRGEVRAPAGTMLAVSGDLPNLMTLGQPSDWMKWNFDRDRDVLGAGDATDLPEELANYSSELQRNGHWVSTREYGPVWVPTTHVSVDWAPYRNGRWVWINDDFVWVSHEPWGWAPYHYGRWVHLGDLGWAWVPPPRNEVYWGPGYVGWVSTDTDVAWVPLAPAEIYYGYGYFGHYSVNLHHGGPLPPRPPYPLINAHISNGVTILHIDAFIHGRPLPPVYRGNPFLADHGYWGRPRIEPERERMIRMPVIRDIPPAHVPPPHLAPRPAPVPPPGPPQPVIAPPVPPPAPGVGVKPPPGGKPVPTPPPPPPGTIQPVPKPGQLKEPKPSLPPGPPQPPAAMPAPDQLQGPKPSSPPSGMPQPTVTPENVRRQMESPSSRREGPSRGVPPQTGTPMPTPGQLQGPKPSSPPSGMPQPTVTPESVRRQMESPSSRREGPSRGGSPQPATAMPSSVPMQSGPKPSLPSGPPQPTVTPQGVKQQMNQQQPPAPAAQQPPPAPGPQKKKGPTKEEEEAAKMQQMMLEQRNRGGGPGGGPPRF